MEACVGDYAHQTANLPQNRYSDDQERPTKKSRCDAYEGLRLLNLGVNRALWGSYRINNHFSFLNSPA